MNRRPLTWKQGIVLLFIVEHWQRTGVSPHADEIGEAFGIRHSASHRYLITLAEKGYLDRIVESARVVYYRPTRRGRDAAAANMHLRARVRRK